MARIVFAALLGAHGEPMVTGTLGPAGLPTPAASERCHPVWCRHLGQGDGQFFGRIGRGRSVAGDRLKSFSAAAAMHPGSPSGTCRS